MRSSQKIIHNHNGLPPTKILCLTNSTIDGMFKVNNLFKNLGEERVLKLIADTFKSFPMNKNSEDQNHL